MNYPIEQLSPNSKIWVFLSPKVLNHDDEITISNLSVNFLENWTSHQMELNAGFTILHNRFLVFAVDESMNNAGGCSVDKLFKFTKELSSKFNIDFLNRFNVVIKNGETVNTLTIAEIEKQISENTIDRDSIVFNTLISSIGELQNAFEVPLHSTWLNRYLNVQKV